MGSQSGSRRTRVERGIYLQDNGKYAVCCRHAGRLRFRTVDGDLAAARRAGAALIAAARAGVEPVSPHLRFDTVTTWWLERIAAKVADSTSTRASSTRHATPAKIRTLMASSEFVACLTSLSGRVCSLSGHAA